MCVRACCSPPAQVREGPGSCHNLCPLSRAAPRSIGRAPAWVHTYTGAKCEVTVSAPGRHLDRANAAATELGFQVTSVQVRVHSSGVFSAPPWNAGNAAVDGTKGLQSARPDSCRPAGLLQYCHCIQCRRWSAGAGSVDTQGIASVLWRCGAGSLPYPSGRAANSVRDQHKVL